MQTEAVRARARAFVGGDSDFVDSVIALKRHFMNWRHCKVDSYQGNVQCGIGLTATYTHIRKVYDAELGLLRRTLIQGKFSMHLHLHMNKERCWACSSVEISLHRQHSIA